MPSTNTDQVILDINVSPQSLSINSQLTVKAMKNIDTICLWLNPGFKITKVESSFGFPRVKKLNYDPDLNLLKLNSVEIVFDVPIKEGDLVDIKIWYKGSANTLISPYWGSFEGEHLLKQETLWYPVTSCETIMTGFFLTHHCRAEIRVTANGLIPVTSLDLMHHEKDMYHWMREGLIDYVSLLASKFKVDELAEDNLHVYLYKHPSIEADLKVEDIADVLSNVIIHYLDTYNYKLPYSQLHVTIMPSGGGFLSGSLISIDADHIKSKNEFMASLLHEYAHIWWGRSLIPRDSESVWLIEAIPEYITYIGLKRLGLEDEAKKYLKTKAEIAASLIRNRKYISPARIFLPLQPDEDESIRHVTTIMFVELSDKLGEEELIRILIKPIKDPDKIQTISWKDIRRELINKNNEVNDILKRYLL